MALNVAFGITSSFITEADFLYAAQAIVFPIDIFTKSLSNDTELQLVELYNTFLQVSIFRFDH